MIGTFRIDLVEEQGRGGGNREEGKGEGKEEGRGVIFEVNIT